jgi:hypothetical protein
VGAANEQPGIESKSPKAKGHGQSDNDFDTGFHPVRMYVPTSSSPTVRASERTDCVLPRRRSSRARVSWELVLRCDFSACALQEAIESWDDSMHGSRSIYF